MSLFAEWHSHCQDQKVYDKPAASEEANGEWQIMYVGLL